MKKFLNYLPHIVIAAFVLPAAFGKITGAEMSVQLFESLNMGGLRVILGVVQVLLVIGLFKKKCAMTSAALIAAMMVAALMLLGVHAQAVIVLILALVVYFGCCTKKGSCKDGSCSHGACKSEDMNEERSYEE